MTRATHDRTRRNLMLGAVGGVAVTALGRAQAAVAPAAATREWQREADVVVAGSGAAALTAAVFAEALGNRVIVLEKGPITGGTTRKSGGVFWIPNHVFLRQRGIDDSRADCLQYLCRMAYSERFRPDSPTLGLDPPAYALLEAFYDNGYRMVDKLREMNALQIAPFNMWHLQRPEPDYQNHLPENKVSKGRSLAIKKADGSDGNGAEYVDQYVAYLEQRGVPILTDHRVASLVRNAKNEIVGVEVDTDEGRIAVRAKKAVIFGTGGYAHNLDQVRYHQRIFLYGSCAVPMATGDFIDIAGAVGARMGSLHTAWRSQALVEVAVKNRSMARCVDMPPGNSMFMVNTYGRRVVNEKRNYNDRSEVHLTYDPNNGNFPNHLLFIVYDQRNAELFGGSDPLPSTPTGAPYVIAGATLDELSQNIADRLETIRTHIGTVKLAPDFAANLHGTFKRFNEYARNGVDPEFQRGAQEYDRVWGPLFQPPREGTRWPVQSDMPNPALYPLQEQGPYYAMIVGPGALDTSGGPAIDERARVLDTAGKPIPGLYGAGNCIAAPSREAYFGAGGTIGPAMTFGYIAAMNAHQEPAKDA